MSIYKMGNYKLVRQSRRGRISRSNIQKAGAIALGVLGLVVIGSMFSNGDDYQYNQNYASYAQQLESEMGIDLPSSMEEQINELQMFKSTIEDYQDSDMILDQNKAYETLAQNYSNIFNLALNTLKQEIANGHGGSSDDYKVRYVDADGSWVASSEESGAITLTGDKRKLADSIGQIQDFDSSSLGNLDYSSKSDYVAACGKVVNRTLSIVVDNAKHFK